MKKRLITIATALALLVVLGCVFEKPLLAQISAALTQNVDEPGRNPFALRLTPQPGIFEVGNFVVPDGKRYVIEQFTAFCQVVSSTYMSDVILSATTGGTREFMSAPAFLNDMGSGTGIPTWGASGMTRLYADPGTTIALQANQASGFAASDTCNFYVSGYIINNP
jgi:hypothetical protein